MHEIDDSRFAVLVGNGIPIDRLERRLRPDLGIVDWEEDRQAHDNFGDYSKVGFLGEDERLLEVVYEDWKTIEGSGTTHGAIATRLEALYKGDETVLHSDYEYLKPRIFTAGYQSCPWECGDAYGQLKGSIIKRGLSDDQIEAARFGQIPWILQKHRQEIPDIERRVLEGRGGVFCEFNNIITSLNW